jgi:hypothetical protein
MLPPGCNTALVYAEQHPALQYDRPYNWGLYPFRLQERTPHYDEVILSVDPRTFRFYSTAQHDCEQYLFAVQGADYLVSYRQAPLPPAAFFVILPSMEVPLNLFFELAAQLLAELSEQDAVPAESRLWLAEWMASLRPRLLS